MDWKTEAIFKLQNYNAKKMSLQVTAAEIDRLTMQIARKYKVARNQHAGITTPADIAPLDDIVHREELQFVHDDTRRWIEVVDKALQALSDDERLILDRFYIERNEESVGQLCDELCLERSRVYQLKDKAIRHFTLVLYGVIKD